MPFYARCDYCFGVFRNHSEFNDHPRNGTCLHGCESPAYKYISRFGAGYEKMKERRNRRRYGKRDSYEGLDADC